MNEIIRKIVELAEDVEPKEGQWKPTYEALEKFTDAVLALIPDEAWEIQKCGTCNGMGFVQQYSNHEADYGRTWIEDCSCVVDYEAQLEEQYQAHLAEKSEERTGISGQAEVNVEKVE